jgi:hypothetical protein
MSIYSSRITVGTVATLLVEPSTMTQQVQLLNAGTIVVRIGSEDVSTTLAWGLPALPTSADVARTIFSTSIEPGDSLYGITPSGSAAVNVFVVRKTA